MIRDWLTPDKINVINSIDNWKNAVRLSAEPLLAQGYMAEHYIEAILKSHEELGPYYLLAPGLAMPHARPEQGALRNGLSLLYIKEGISFGSTENDPVYVIIMLCARSGNEHITMIGELAELFSDQQKLERLLKADDIKAIQAVID
ncbi:PTS sugar transporter subunit IIA [Klebsiella variicola subsp. variicola]|uniref:PTS sugar transporter subunit IIA n=1 Tax=Klebsiella variicola TaxID=244366 RepID=A0AAW9PGK8_KLEVA|nr:PTS sugar transporter subunit IIA [Klebsiella variicola]EIY5384800.1 PTS sugar transporter subunit IIA [Klebsiella variicola]EKZ6050518.1 PTS sugar transporter subunit IIA [Klebsiella variicola]ELN8756476.1 PTS sugar transporter subunit IIA [Klebsiella variicola]ELT5802065.1 PTS sugar transporter subunit IIA [Klebsiella variicola]EWD82032.1 PTS system ascorbate-specific IIA component [Klebsiella variicola]